MHERPIMLGYVTVPDDVDPVLAESVSDALRAFSEREGFLLGGVFVDHGARRPGETFHELVTAASHWEVTAVAVWKLTDLGSNAVDQESMRCLLQDDAQVRVLIVEPQS